MPETPLTIAIRGPVATMNSFSLDHRALAAEFMSRGHALRLYSDDGEITDDPRLRKIQARSALIDSVPDVYLTHRFPWFYDNPPGRLNVAVMPFEYFSLSNELIEELKKVAAAYDLIFVYASFLKDLMIRHGAPASKVKVARLGYPGGKCSPSTVPVMLPMPKKFKFLYLGGGAPRKGTDVLLRAFVEEFSPQEDVALVLKTFSYPEQREWLGRTLAAARKTKAAPPEIIHIHEDSKEIYGYYTACDAGVFPFRGEGYCLPVLEMMACGRPSIVTNGMGPLEFCNDANSFLLKAGPGSLNGLDCLEPDKSDLRRLMRLAFENRALVRSKGLQAREDVAGLTWSGAADIWIEYFREALMRKPKSSPKKRFFTERDHATIGYNAPDLDVYTGNIAAKVFRGQNTAVSDGFLPRGLLHPAQAWLNGHLAQQFIALSEQGPNDGLCLEQTPYPHVVQVRNAKGKPFSVLFLFVDPWIKLSSDWEAIEREEAVELAFPKIHRLYDFYDSLAAWDFTLTNAGFLKKWCPAGLRKQILVSDLPFGFPFESTESDSVAGELAVWGGKRAVSVRNMAGSEKLTAALFKMPVKAFDRTLFLREFPRLLHVGFSPVPLRKTIAACRTHVLACDESAALMIGLETMTCGRVLVAPKGMSLDRVVSDGENGFLVKKTDWKHVKEIVREMAGNTARAAEIGEKARRDAVNFKKMYLSKELRYVINSTINSGEKREQLCR